MSFESAIASACGNEMVLAKSFGIIAEDDALSWYFMLKPKSIYSWENLWVKIVSYFQGFISESLTSSNLLQCKQHTQDSFKENY